MVNDPFDVLLKSTCSYFVENFCYLYSTHVLLVNGHVDTSAAGSILHPLYLFKEASTIFRWRLYTINIQLVKNWDLNCCFSMDFACQKILIKRYTFGWTDQPIILGYVS